MPRIPEASSFSLSPSGAPTPEHCAVRLSLSHALRTIAKKRRGITMMPDELKSPRMGAPCDPAPLYVVGDPNGSGMSTLTKSTRFREMRIVGRPRRDRGPNRFRGSLTCRRHQPQLSTWASRRPGRVVPLTPDQNQPASRLRRGNRLDRRGTTRNETQARPTRAED